MRVVLLFRSGVNDFQCIKLFYVVCFVQSQTFLKVLR